MFLLMAYSLGLGIPFLIAAAFLDRARGMIRAVQRHSHGGQSDKRSGSYSVRPAYRF